MTKVINFSIFAFLFSALVGLSGCLETDQLKGDDTLASNSDTKSFQGCVSGQGIDASRIQINFEFLADSDRVNIYRNGNKIYSSTSKSTSSFTDTALTEGIQYEYTCELVYGSKAYMGSRILQLSTVSINPPVFTGVLSVQKLTPQSVLLTWSVPSGSGPAASSYKIYYNAGSTVNWSLAAKQTSTVGSYQATLSGLGDQMPYAFGVRACTISNVCDTNTAQVSTVLDQGGAPLTTGASSASVVNGLVMIQAPWTDSLGAVQNRYVYQRTGAVGGTDISLYTLVRTVNVTDLANVSTQISVSGILENTTYWYIVQDADPSGVNNGNVVPVSVNTGDLQPPVFSGINSLALGAPADQSLVIHFNALPREGTADIGALTGTSYYNIYVTYASYPGTPANPCSSGALWGSFPQLASPYAPGAASITLSGLTPRTTYSVCLRAQDAAGNISINTDNLSITTRDLTAPSFDGIQTISFNSSDSKVYLTWNASSASDLNQYRVKLWKNTATPTLGQITTFYRTSGSSSTGTSFSTGEYTFTNLDVVYAVVDACDDAQVIPGGTQNCSAYTNASAKNVSLPAFLPPQGFPGIKSAVSQISTVESQATIAWNAPSPWTADYIGFKIYSVNPNTNALTALKSCPCVTPGSCTTLLDTSCGLTGLDPGRTYRFHVRAYNSGNFETTYLDPAVNYADKKIADTTAPTFTSGLNIGVSPTYILTWNPATDNQYTGDGATIQYKVYRKANSTFATATNPSADGVLVSTTTSLTLSDSGWLDGTTYYYTVCANDISSNVTCDGNVKSISVTDVTVPTITSFTTLKSTQADLKRWDLNWTMADNTTSTGSLRVRLYKSVTVSASTATTSDTLVLDSMGDLTLASEVGPINQKRYINYLLWVQDAAGNITTRALSVLSDNVITLSSIQRNTGTTGGGQVIVLTGTGFSKGSLNGFGTSTAISLAGASCTSVDVINSTLMTCITPTGVNGPAVAQLDNPEGSSVVQAGLFTYLSVSAEVCDNPGTWGSQMAAGTGIVSDPFIICNATHLDNVRKKITDGMTYNYIDGNYYFKLGAHINLNSVTFPSIGGESSGRTFAGSFDGDNYSVLNWSRSSTTAHSGFIGRASALTLKNIKLLNANLTSNQENSALAVGYSAGATTIDNVTVNGTLTNTKNAGPCCGNAAALVLGATDGSSSLTMNNITVTGSILTAAVPASGVANYGGFSSGGIVNITNVTATDVRVRSTASTVSGFGSINPGGGTHTLSNIYVSGNVDTDITYASGRAGIGISPVANSATFNLNKIGIRVITNVLGGSGGVNAAFTYTGCTTGCTLNISESYFIGTANYASYGNTYNAGFLSLGTGVNISNVITVSNSYMNGETIAGSNFGGAFHLGNVASWTGLTISNFMSAVKLTGGYSSNGVAVGVSTFTASNSFWDYVKATRLTTEAGAISMNARTTTQMQDQGTNIFSAAGWDFTPVTGKWKWCGTSDYPHLMWETCP